MTKPQNPTPEEKSRSSAAKGEQVGPPTAELSLVDLASRTQQRSQTHRRTARRLVVATIATGLLGVLALARIEALDFWSFFLLAMVVVFALIVQRALRNHRKSQDDLQRAKTELQRVADTDAIATVDRQLNDPRNPPN